jgi:hypothetical protein
VGSRRDGLATWVNELSHFPVLHELFTRLGLCPESFQRASRLPPKPLLGPLR